MKIAAPMAIILLLFFAAVVISLDGCSIIPSDATDALRKRVKETIGVVSQKRHQANIDTMQDAHKWERHTRCDSIRGDTLRSTIGNTPEKIVDWLTECGPGELP